MKCSSCDGLGYVEEWFHANAALNSIVKQCPKRCNIAGYSLRVQQGPSLKRGESLPPPPPNAKVTLDRKPCNVIPFRRG